MTLARRIPLFSVVFWLGGCGKPGICGDKDLTVEISGNHGHAERIEKKALELGPKRYKLEGGSHDHTFRLGEAEIAKLRAGESVELRSTSMNAHVHELRVTCAK